MKQPAFCADLDDGIMSVLTDNCRQKGSFSIAQGARRLCRAMKLVILLSILSMMCVLPASADSGNPLPENPDQWRFSLAFPMLWAPTINGRVRGDTRVDFEIGFKDILENLDMGLMAELYANRGPFGVALRINYMQVNSTNNIDGLVFDSIETDLEMGVNDFLASWEIHDQLRLVTGIRHIHAKLDLDIATKLPPEGGEMIRVTDDNMYDFLVGVNYDHWFSPKWGVMLNADIGLFGDYDRDYSTEIRALYRISDLNNFWFGFRYLNIGSDSKDNGRLLKVDMSQVGPTLGWAFTF
ncbi:MAG: hypothetical protein OQJ84_07570 [Xanthomonadales bacterium]|nr:hypothetical protein [Xanthomonadales bacterium]